MAETYILEKNAAPANLDEQFPSLAEQAVVGLGWDPADGGASIDLDSAVALYDEGKKHLATVFFDNLEYKVGSEVVIKHNGDDTTGGKSDTGPDETINIKLNKLPDNVKHVVIIINDFKGGKFGRVKNSFGALYDKDEKELVRHNLAKEFDNFNGVVVADIFRGMSGEWKIKAISAGINGNLNEIAAKVPELI
jgi:tellurium resistance protein TerZ